MKKTFNPISTRELRKRLAGGAIRFYFEKKDGTLREAVGTLQPGLIPYEHLPKGEREASPMVVNFYDLQKSAWRSLSVGAPVFE